MGELKIQHVKVLHLCAACCIAFPSSDLFPCSRFLLGSLNSSPFGVGVTFLTLFSVRIWEINPGEGAGMAELGAEVEQTCAAGWGIGCGPALLLHLYWEMCSLESFQIDCR